MRILIADDDPDVLAPLEIALKAAGHRVLSARDGLQAWLIFTQEHPDFVVLDVNMPSIDGVELTRRISGFGDPRVPVILLTGRGGERDKVSALDLGADDYIIKPFSVPELLARIRAVWRRTQPAARTLNAGGLVVDPLTRHVTVDGVSVEVTPTEFALLLVLMEHVGQVVRMGAIMGRVWNTAVSEDLVRVTVFRLRRKIESDPKQPRYLHTVPSVGFMVQDRLAPAPLAMAEDEE
ncbi:MAG TPA: response regulator transcription factor [Chloroflexota bacterium]|nr:response regulator transcription factor [Chloroflexota bacterium]